MSGVLAGDETVSTQDERLAAAARKFQRSMEKLNLGVTISADGQPAVAVTVKCPHCDRYIGNLSAHIAAKHPGETP